MTSLTNGQKWWAIFYRKKSSNTLLAYERVSNLVEIRYMQIEIQKQFHFTLTELAIFKKYDNINY